MKTVAIIQARWSSSRLPGKVLLPLAGKTVLQHVVQRVRRVHPISTVVVAASINTKDLPIVKMCAENKISLYIGSEDDVLDRYYQAARLYEADHIVRITADCPVIDPEIIDRVVNEHLAGGADLTSNTLEETFPDGQDIEILTFAALERTWKKATLRSQREHVTPYLKKNPKTFRLKNVVHDENLAAMRWTLDQQEDYVFLKKIYTALYKKKTMFGMQDILEYLKRHPDLKKINSHVVRNEGYKKSLLHDRQIKVGV